MRLNWRRLAIDAIATIFFFYVGIQFAIGAVGLTNACAIYVYSFFPELFPDTRFADGSFVNTVVLIALLASYVVSVPAIAIEVFRRLTGRTLPWIYMAAGALTVAAPMIGSDLTGLLESKASFVMGATWILSGAVGGAVYWLVTIKLRAALALLLGRLLCGVGSRGYSIGVSCCAILLGISVSLVMAGGAVAEPADDLHQVCRQVRDDDTLREYSPALRDETVQAFKKLFPDAKSVPADDELETQAIFRCMNGKVLVCAVGANLPCVKMNAARDNPGANEFCRQNPADEDSVPAYAVGHDSVYSYKCRNGRAEVVEPTWDLDERGFARKLWAELPAR